MSIAQGDLRIEIAKAMTLSTAAVVMLTGLLTAAGVPKPAAFAGGQFCSITNCVVSEDGTNVLLTYWQPDQGRQAPRRGLAEINLCNPGCTMKAIATDGQPWGISRLASRTCYAADAAGRMILRPIDHRDPNHCDDISLPVNCTAELTASADGKTVVAWVLGKLLVFDINRQRVCWQLEGDIECFAYDTQAGLFAALDGRIVELSLENGSILRTIASGYQRARALAISPDSKSLAWLDWDGVIGVVRISDGQGVWRCTDHAARTLPATHRPVQYARVLDFSSDGRYLATAAFEGEWVLAIWNTRTGVRVRTLRGHDATINGAVFLPDGSLASWGADGTLRLWNTRRGAVRRIFRAQELSRPGEPLERPRVT